VAVERGVPTQAIRVFGKANLLRSLSSSGCLRYALSQPGVRVAICGCGTVGQIEDNIRAVQGFRKMTSEECAAARKRAVSGAGVYTATTLEYWKKKSQVMDEIIDQKKREFLGRSALVLSVEKLAEFFGRYLADARGSK
jgi:predicted aldo/keto reductase-like oxidoreductase